MMMNEIKDHNADMEIQVPGKFFKQVRIINKEPSTGNVIEIVKHDKDNCTLVASILPGQHFDMDGPVYGSGFTHTGAKQPEVNTCLHCKKTIDLDDSFDHMIPDNRIENDSFIFGTKRVFPLCIECLANVRTILDPQIKAQQELYELYVRILKKLNDKEEIGVGL